MLVFLIKVTVALPSQPLPTPQHGGQKSGSFCSQTLRPLSLSQAVLHKLGISSFVLQKFWQVQGNLGTQGDIAPTRATPARFSSVAHRPAKGCRGPQSSL
jgi:hypothetical protein